MVMVLKHGKFKNENEDNPYRSGTIKSILFEEDFSDLTVDEISDLLNTTRNYFYRCIQEIRDNTGKSVAYVSELKNNTHEKE